MGLGSKLKKAAGFVPGVNLVVNAAKDVGSAVNDARKDVTKAGAGVVADVARPLGPAAVPLLTAALVASGVGAPLAAALAAGAVQGSKAVDATGSLNAGAKAGATSGAVAGISGLAGGALTNAISPYLSQGLSSIVDVPMAAELAKVLSPIVSQGVTSGGLTSLTGTGSFGQGFTQGALGSAFSQGLGSVLDKFGVTDKTARAGIESQLSDYVNKEFFSPELKNALVGGAAGLGGAALLKNLFQIDEGATPSGGQTPPAPPPVPLSIGQIGQTFTPKQNLGYGDFVPPKSAGVGAIPLVFNQAAAVPAPSYFAARQG